MSQKLEQTLTLRDAVAVVSGGVIGSSILITPSLIAKGVPVIGIILALWVLGGIFAILNALTMAELSSLFPSAGGQYIYLRNAFGPIVGFLFAWTDVLLVKAGAAAAVSMGIGMYVVDILPAPAGLKSDGARVIVAIVTLILLAAINIKGMKGTVRFQTIGTIIKLISLLSLVFLPFMAIDKVSISNLSPILPNSWTPELFGGILTASVAILWSYGGWEQLGHLAEEIEEPRKNVPRALAIGIAIVAFIYIGLSISIHATLPLPIISSSSAIGSDFARILVGSPGAIWVSIVVIGSSIMALNAMIMSGPRVILAISRDGLIPNSFGNVHNRFGTPSKAIIILATWAIILLTLSVGIRSISLREISKYDSWSGWSFLAKVPLYEALITYVVFGVLVFNFLMVLAIFIFRRRTSPETRAYSVPGYPIIPLISAVITLLLMILTVWQRPTESFAAICIILAGWPYFIWKSRKNKDFVP